MLREAINPKFIDLGEAFRIDIQTSSGACTSDATSNVLIDSVREIQILYHDRSGNFQVASYTGRRYEPARDYLKQKKFL